MPFTTPDTESAIIRAYTDFNTVADQAAKVPPEQARGLLKPYVGGDYLDAQVEAITNLQADGHEPWGRAVVHVIDVKHGDDTAVLESCDDHTQAGLADRNTHELIPETTGTSRVHMSSNLKLGEDGRWRLHNLIQLKTPCTPEPSSS